HVRINQSTNRVTPSIFLSQGFAPDALAPANAEDVTLVSYDRSSRWPTSYQWNVNVQRQLPGQVVVEVGYTGNRLVNNWREIDGNPAPPGPGDVNARRRFTTATLPETRDTFTLADIVRIEKDGWSQYHALHTKIEKRYSSGLSLLAVYTWSRTRALGDGYQDPANLEAEVAPADVDRSHYFVASGLYDLPFGRDTAIGRSWGPVADTLLAGWSIGPIVTVATGVPLDLTVNGNPSNTGQNDRPNVIGEWRLEHPTVDRWFNTSAFVANDPYTFGNAPRNLLRGPGTFNLDLVLRKSFRLSNGVSLDVRFESFNATNTPPLGNPNTQVGDQSFGRISSAGPARSNQIAVKVRF
ncbi:MAG: hypothetical protein ACRD2X_04675, partial [Vicinamibacteraceae bacterium]